MTSSVKIVLYVRNLDLIGRDLDSVYSLLIKEFNHLFLKFATTVNKYSLEYPMSTDNVFLDKQSNSISFLV